MADYLVSPEALDDLRSIRDFIALDSSVAAEKVLDELFAAFEQLAEWPGQGHIRPDFTNRKVLFWPVGSYLVVYRGKPAPLEIVAVLHGARDIPAVMQSR
ncbi:MAG: type II toxin-antitoxin system RelE/ParE family toxin [Terriglobales bacterium]